MRRLLECVVNFSEGRNLDSLFAIAKAIADQESVDLLHIDRGEGANRTVFTFIGEPEGVCEAAYQAIRVVQEVIDMSQHQGEHPRIGAADVVPFIPISGVTMEEAVELSREVASRVASELGIPVYCYEESAFVDHKRNLASCRHGEYEGIKTKISDPKWHPDFGKSDYNDVVKRSGISVIGARNFLLAVNFNLSTSDCSVAKKIASKVRQMRKDGYLEGVKAIGWYIPEYGFTQVSTNITNINLATLDKVWLTICELAQQYGVQVTGTEIIGLLPQKALLDAAKGFGYAESDPYSQMCKVVEKMNFNQLEPFVIEEKVIEYVKPINSNYHGE